MPIIQGLASALDLFEDVGCFRGPNEWLGLIVVLVNISANGHDQLLDIAEAASSQAVFSEIAEEAFDHVQPRTAGRCEVKVKPRMARQPPLHLRMFVRRVTIDNQVEDLVGGCEVVDHSKEAQPFLMSMTVIAHGDYCAVECVERSE